jgi:hypothetical protein
MNRAFFLFHGESTRTMMANSDCSYDTPKDTGVKLFRVFLLVAVVIAVIGQIPSPTIAQAVPAYVIYPKTTGTVGTFTARNPGVTCESENTPATPQVKLVVTGPTAKLVNGVTSGRVDWTPKVYQNLLDSRGLHVVRQGATQSLTLSTGNTTAFQSSLFEHLPGGGYYSGGGTLTWFNANSTVRGTYDFVFERYSFIHGSRSDSTSNYCNRIVEPTLSLSTNRTTVDTVISLYGTNFPISQPVKITWRGNLIGTATSDVQGNVSATYKLAATPMGTYPLALDGGLKWKISSQVTVVPRIKVIPSTAGRGQTVKVSLRGFAKGEVVRVRWIKGGGWVELGRVTMSSTGSGELWIAVPTWAPDGASSVRGDGTSGRAQTNAVFISGGAGFKAASENTPTPTPTATTTATATLTATIPASPEISPTSTEITETATPSPTETMTATIEPTLEPSPTATETFEPTPTIVSTEAPPEPTGP